jgi:hypothetical protein
MKGTMQAAFSTPSAMESNTSERMPPEGKTTFIDVLPCDGVTVTTVIRTIDIHPAVHPPRLESLASSLDLVHRVPLICNGPVSCKYGAKCWALIRGTQPDIYDSSVCKAYS